MGKEHDVSNSSSMGVVQFLLANLKNGRPAKGKMNEAASLFNVCRKSVSRIWKSAQQQRGNDEVITAGSKRCGRFRKLKHEVDLEKIRNVHHQKRRTIRGLSKSIKVSKTTVGRWNKQKKIKHHSNAIKPTLTAPNKLLRLSFSLQSIHFDSMSNVLKFKPMENIIHIDEKWFYLTTKSQNYYMTPLELAPHRTCKSQKFIPKVMFMCAVCRPIFDEDGRVIFDGKIGMWPFIEQIEAVRNSKKRPKGTMETKPIESINKQVIKNCVIDQIIPAIKMKWPSCLSKTIFIQQDNARPHITNNDPDFSAAANKDGFNISLVQQPPNSPDMNVNDLGFFCAIQSLQQEQACSNADELVAAVFDSFNKLDPMTLNKVFLSLQCVLQEVLKVKGGNNYKFPHMKKDSLILQNALPENLEVSLPLVRECIEYLHGEDYTHGIKELMEELGINSEDLRMQIPDLNL